MWMSEERGDTEEMDGGGGDTRSLYVALLTSCFPLLLCPLFLHSGLALSLCPFPSISSLPSISSVLCFFITLSLSLMLLSLSLFLSLFRLSLHSLVFLTFRPSLLSSCFFIALSLSQRHTPSPGRLGRITPKQCVWCICVCMCVWTRLYCACVRVYAYMHVYCEYKITQEIHKKQYIRMKLTDVDACS